MLTQAAPSPGAFCYDATQVVRAVGVDLLAAALEPTNPRLAYGREEIGIGERFLLLFPC
jgi:hypothetical protein